MYKKIWIYVVHFDLSFTLVCVLHSIYIPLVCLLLSWSKLCLDDEKGRERENLLPGNRYFSVCTVKLHGAAKKKWKIIWLLYILCNMLHWKLYLQFVNWRQKIDALNVKERKVSNQRSVRCVELTFFFIMYTCYDKRLSALWETS
jgi:hypothetical protein